MIGLGIAPWDCFATAWRRNMSVGAMAARISIAVLGGEIVMKHLPPERVKWMGEPLKWKRLTISELGNALPHYLQILVRLLGRSLPLSRFLFSPRVGTS